jgi:trimethylguanosine synthase
VKRRVTLIAVKITVTERSVQDFSIRIEEQTTTSTTMAELNSEVLGSVDADVAADSPKLDEPCTDAAVQKKTNKKRKRKKNKNQQQQLRFCSRTNFSSSSNNNNNKRPKKRERFWIEDCADTKYTEEFVIMGQNQMVPTLELLITRSTLTDNYRQAPLVRTETVDGVQQDEGSFRENDASAALKDGSGLAKKDCGKVSTDDNLEHTQDGSNESTKSENEARVEEKMKAFNVDNPSAALTNSKLPSHDKEEDSIFDRALILVKRGNSAKKPMQSGTPTIDDFEPLPNGDCGDSILNPYPKDQVGDKFWSQRRRFFTRFDQGIQLDPESWFSVTPEAIANHIAAHLVGNRENVVILDPFCGCGGNVIAFARRKEVDLVVAVDTDLSKLQKAAANAAIYQVPPKKIVFIHDNGCRVLACYQDKKLTKCYREKVETQVENMVKVSGFQIGGMELLPPKVDCIFLSPPWGGVDYGKVGKRNYNLQCIQVEAIDNDTSYLDGQDILQYAANCLGRDGPIAYFLPRNTNGIQFGQSVLKSGYGGPVVMEQNVLNGKLKTITAYIGL